jgi:DNA invertase Pin-like site-specific DNA recombinase
LSGIDRNRPRQATAGFGRYFANCEAQTSAGGVYKGRPPSIEASRVRELKAQGMRATDIAKALKIGRASVYRVLGSDGH